MVQPWTSLHRGDTFQFAALLFSASHVHSDLILLVFWLFHLCFLFFVFCFAVISFFERPGFLGLCLNTAHLQPCCIWERVTPIKIG